MIKLAGKSVRPSAVGESALGGKFVQIFHRDHSVPLSLSAVKREYAWESLLREVLLYNNKVAGII